MKKIILMSLISCICAFENETNQNHKISSVRAYVPQMAVLYAYPDVTIKPALFYKTHDTHEETLWHIEAPENRIKELLQKQYIKSPFSS
jgi:hypothetical protein